MNNRFKFLPTYQQISINQTMILEWPYYKLDYNNKLTQKRQAMKLPANMRGVLALVNLNP